MGNFDPTRARLSAKTGVEVRLRLDYKFTIQVGYLPVQVRRAPAGVQDELLAILRNTTAEDSIRGRIAEILDRYEYSDHDLSVIVCN